MIGSIDEIKNLSGIEPQLGPALEQNFFAGVAAIKKPTKLARRWVPNCATARSTLFLACLGMLLYVAFRFKSWGFGIGGVVAIFHDVVITLGIFSIMQWEINLTVIAALLTLVGFSMNDTIVIFDRVRELLRLRRRENLVKLTNDAVNETMSRTVINGTAFLTILASYFSAAKCQGLLLGAPHRRRRRHLLDHLHREPGDVVVGSLEGQEAYGAGRRAKSDSVTDR